MNLEERIKQLEAELEEKNKAIFMEQWNSELFQQHKQLQREHVELQSSWLSLQDKYNQLLNKKNGE